MQTARSVPVRAEASPLSSSAAESATPSPAPSSAAMVDLRMDSPRGEDAVALVPGTRLALEKSDGPSPRNGQALIDSFDAQMRVSTTPRRRNRSESPDGSTRAMPFDFSPSRNASLHATSEASATLPFSPVINPFSSKSVAFGPGPASSPVDRSAGTNPFGMSVPSPNPFRTHGSPERVLGKQYAPNAGSPEAYPPWSLAAKSSHPALPHSPNEREALLANAPAARGTAREPDVTPVPKKSWVAAVTGGAGGAGGQGQALGSRDAHGRQQQVHPHHHPHEHRHASLGPHAHRPIHQMHLGERAMSASPDRSQPWPALAIDGEAAQSTHLTKRQKSRTFAESLFALNDHETDSQQFGKESEASMAVYSFGVCASRGHRRSMEDRYSVTGCVPGCRDASLFAVYDGHGGESAAEFCSEYLPYAIGQALHRREAEQGGAALTREDFVAIFAKTDQEFFATSGQRSGRDRELYVGSTAVCALATGSGQQRSLWIAHVGDSRAVLVREHDAVQLTQDHKPTVPRERARIAAVGGRVNDSRVEGILGMTRAIGDQKFKKFVSVEPDVLHLSVQPAVDRFLILASDGLWDVVDNARAAAIVRDVGNAGDAANRLVSVALTHRNSTDNITVIVVDLSSYRPQPAGVLHASPPPLPKLSSFAVSFPGDLGSSSSVQSAAGIMLPPAHLQNLGPAPQPLELPHAADSQVADGIAGGEASSSNAVRGGGAPAKKKGRPKLTINIA